MAVPRHPMAALRGTQAGRDLMAQVRAHKGGGVAKKTAPVKAAPVEPDADDQPGSEKAAALKFMKRRKASTPK